MTNDTTPLINKLLRGVYFNNVETVRDAWRALLEKGEVSVAAVQGKLRASVWTDRPRGPLVRYFTVLLSLLSELDPAAHRHEIERLRSRKLHPV